jgi:hypothetical protein
LFGVSPDELRPIFTRSRMPLNEAAQAYLRLLAEPKQEILEIRGESAEQKRELLNVQAELEELRIALIDGDSYRAQDVEPIIGNRLSACVAKLLNLPPKIALQVVGQARDTVESLISEELGEAIAELAPFDRKDFICAKFFFEQDEGDNGNGSN